MSARPAPRFAEPAFAVETVTPKLALEYLGRNMRNRPVSRKVVRQYAAAIRRGEWMMNGEAVKFDWNGDLVDGQHRLGAIVESEAAIELLVARNLDPRAFATIDTGKLRGGSDMLALRGIRYPTPISAAYRMLFRYLERNRSKTRISNQQLLKLVDRHPKLVERAYEAMQVPLQTSLIGPTSRIFWFYLACAVDASAARDFMAAIAKANPKQPIAGKLRNRLLQTDLEVIKPSSAVKWAWLVDAWNHHLRGHVPERLPRIYTKLPTLERAPSERQLLAQGRGSDLLTHRRS